MIRSELLCSSNQQRAIRLALLSSMVATGLFHTCASGAGARDDHGVVYDGPSMTAELVTRNTRREVPRIVNRIAISSDGLRMESDSRDGNAKPNLMIQNFNTGQYWLVDQDRRMFVEIPDSPAGLTDSTSPSDYETGILTTKVCGDLPRRAQGPAAWRGNKVTVWLCERGATDGIRQYYSPYWRLVVREEHADGRTSELQNMKRMSVKAASFHPPTDFRSTDINEFMGVTKPLESYVPMGGETGPEGQEKGP